MVCSSSAVVDSNHMVILAFVPTSVSHESPADGGLAATKSSVSASYRRGSPGPCSPRRKPSCLTSFIAVERRCREKLRGDHVAGVRLHRNRGSGRGPGGAGSHGPRIGAGARAAQLGTLNSTLIAISAISSISRVPVTALRVWPDHRRSRAWPRPQSATCRRMPACAAYLVPTEGASRGRGASESVHA